MVCSKQLGPGLAVVPQCVYCMLYHRPVEGALMLTGAI